VIINKYTKETGTHDKKWARNAIYNYSYLYCLVLRLSCVIIKPFRYQHKKAELPLPRQPGYCFPPQVSSNLSIQRHLAFRPRLTVVLALSIV
jgi:hypothetical protein